jgi:hypothetical protein
VTLACVLLLAPSVFRTKRGRALAALGISTLYLLGARLRRRVLYSAEAVPPLYPVPPRGPVAEA